jgi:hypothetical protein
MFALTGCGDRGSAANSATELVAAGDAPSPSLQGDGFRLSVGQGGAAVVKVGEEPYAIESLYSYPGERIGTNVLALSKNRERGAWQIEIGQSGSDRIQIVTRGQLYTLRRTISVERQRIAFSDELLNRTKEPIGILIRHRIVTAEEPKQLLFAGAPWEQDGLVGTGKYLVKRALLGLGLLASGVGYSAENPTVFVSQRRSHLGVIAEDTLSRLQFESHRHQPAFSMEHFALGAGESRTLRWAAYPLSADGDYFEFINRVRRDWQTNFTLLGPWSFFDIIQNWDMLQDSARLKAYLQRTRLGIVAFRPWLDYDNFNFRTGTVISRAEYKRITQQAMAALKEVEPDIKCLGSMQSNLVSPPPETMRRLYEAIPAGKRGDGFYRFTDEQMQLIRDLPLKDCFVTDQEGRHTYELYHNGPQRHPLLAIAVHAVPENGHFAFWMDQAKFMLEEVRLDGLYIDQFSLAFQSDPSQRYSYSRWDGATVDIDPQTGKIIRRYADGAFIGARAHKSLIEYVLSRNGTMVANTYAAAAEVQSLPVMRFTEAWPSFRALNFIAGQRPSLTRQVAKGHLGSPIALGYEPHEDDAQTSDSGLIMKAIIAYLRHGLLYYHFLADISDKGPDRGEFVLVRHMFPMTPLALHPGWIEGKERTVTAVSGVYSRKQSQRPEVHRFELTGKEVPGNCEFSRSEGIWKLNVRMRDWQEVSVILW